MRLVLYRNFLRVTLLPVRSVANGSNDRQLGRKDGCLRATSGVRSFPGGALCRVVASDFI